MFRESVPLEVFHLMMAEMGSAVARYVTDADVIERIAADWEKITAARKVKAGETDSASVSDSTSMM